MKFQKSPLRIQKATKEDLRKAVADEFRKALRQFRGGKYQLAAR